MGMDDNEVLSHTWLWSVILQSVVTELIRILLSVTVVDPGFLRGRQPQRWSANLLFWMRMRYRLDRGGVRPWRPLGSTNEKMTIKAPVPTQFT